MGMTFPTFVSLYYKGYTLDAAPVYPQWKMAIYANAGILIQCNHTNVQIK